MNYIIADTHFYHKNIIKYENRPFESVEYMNNVLIEKWNKTVSKKDTIYHLGDFGFASIQKLSDIISKLNGYKILVMGNHDGKSPKKWQEMGFDEVYKFPILLNNIILSHEPVESWIKTSLLFNIHGHMHSKSMEDINSYLCLSCENTDYKPISFDDINMILNNRFDKFETLKFQIDENTRKRRNKEREGEET